MISTEKLHTAILEALEDIKARDVVSFNVSKITSITDVIIVCSGTSNRHTKSIADRIIEKAASLKVKPLGIEGEQQGEWVLVDLNAVIVHIMLPETRKFYQLEKLWDMSH